jgi:hypothetical protein
VPVDLGQFLTHKVGAGELKRRFRQKGQIMDHAVFDTLAFAKRLQDAGLKKEVSEAIASAIQDVAMSNVATKADVREAVHDMTVRMGALIAGAVAVLGFIITLN